MRTIFPNSFYKYVLTLVTLLIFCLNTGFLVIGHRGDPINAPEETFQSFDIAFSEGANYCELDLHRSQDGVLVVSHDRDLQRVTGQNIIVSQAPFSQLQKLHTANGEPIHSLDELFAHYQNNPNAKFLLETKKTAAGNPKDMETLMVQAIRKYHMENRVMVHSFSAESLENMQNLMPNIPRILIVGSLSRINFDYLRYSTGINVSSNLITPQLVNKLHLLDQKVFVWDEMTEKQQSWNKIVNLPIDGVVTNYPAIGASYQQLKDGARIIDMNMDGALVSTEHVPTYENPYRPDLQKAALKPFDTIHISQKVSVGNETFYQIDTNRFVNADAIDLEDALPIATSLLNQSVVLKKLEPMQTAYKSPLYPQQTTGIVLPSKPYQILAVRSISGSLWFKLAPGWVQSQTYLIRFKSMANPSQCILDNYLQLQSKYRLNNIDLSAQLPSFITLANAQLIKHQPLQMPVPNSQFSGLYPLVINYVDNEYNNSRG